MSLTLIRVALTALLMVALPSWASDLPTSENPTTGKWLRMQPTSFQPTELSALEQCNRAANADPHDRLTPAMCQQLPELIQRGQCRKVSVRDGVVFDYMNGRLNGHSGLTRGVEKALGRLDPALLCDLGNRTFAYWFVGDKGKSCNNIGIVFTAPPVPAPTPVAGVCGGNATRFAYSVTDWPAGGNFCASGEQSSPHILFPQAGGSTRWSCQGLNGGAATPCKGERDALPPSPPPTPKVEVLTRPVCLTRRYIMPSAGGFVHVPGLSVEVCQGRVPIPDIFVNLPSSVTVVTREECQ